MGAKAFRTAAEQPWCLVMVALAGIRCIGLRVAVGAHLQWRLLLSSHEILAALSMLVSCSLSKQIFPQMLVCLRVHVMAVSEPLGALHCGARRSLRMEADLKEQLV